jgi:hypothetical protein
MNKISRTITGGVIMIFSISAIIFLIFLGNQRIDYVSVAISVFSLIIGILIFFNKKEDEIEKIKKRK